MIETGRAIKIISSCYEVLVTSQERVPYVTMGKPRKAHPPVVGDLMEFERFADQNGIQRILPRKNVLVRPSIASVDRAIIVMSYKDPDFSTTLINHLIFSVCYTEICPVLCIAELDLIAENDTIHEEIQYYIDSGYKVYQNGKGYVGEDPIQVLKGDTSALTGQSGAGENSLLNRINPTFHLQTQEIGEALDRGKHTTRHYKLHEIAGGWVADALGFFSPNFTVMNIIQLTGCIPDLQNVRDVCRFRDCIHVSEPDCAIRAAVGDGTIRRERHVHYPEIISTTQKIKSRY